MAYELTNPSDLSTIQAALGGTQPFVFSLMPEVHAVSGDATPIFGRSPSDGKTVGALNISTDGLAGDLFHLTTGTNTVAGRSVSDGVVNSGSAVITSATANFAGTGTQGEGGDIGRVVIGTGIPTGAKILSVQSATQATLDRTATQSGTNVALQIGASLTGNTNGAVIAIGIDNGLTGLALRNKYLGTGLLIDQLATVAGASAYAAIMVQRSTVAPHTRLFMESTGTQPLQVWQINAAAPAGTPYVQWFDKGVGGSSLAGQILSDTGTLDWKRSIETRAPNSSGTPIIRVRDEGTTPSEAYLGGKGNGECGLRVYRYAGSGTIAYSYGWVAETDRFKLKVGQGPADKGSEVFSTMMEVRCIAGTGNKGQMAFFGATPVNQQSIAGALSTVTDAAAKTVLTNILTALANLGLATNATT